MWLTEAWMVQEKSGLCKLNIFVTKYIYNIIPLRAYQSKKLESGNIDSSPGFAASLGTLDFCTLICRMNKLPPSNLDSEMQSMFR